VGASAGGKAEVFLDVVAVREFAERDAGELVFF